MIKDINRVGFLLILSPIIFILLISSGCSPNNNNPPKNENTPLQSFNDDSEKNENTSFQSLFENNPIDKAFKAEMLNFNGSTLQEVSSARKLKIYWEKEVHNSYDILIKLLDDENKIALETSQKAWEEYIKNVETLNSHIYYLPESKYTIVGYNANYMLDLAESVKNRAFELMGWVYAFTGEVNFIFEKW